jgi:hypothetical protein
LSEANIQTRQLRGTFSSNLWKSSTSSARRYRACELRCIRCGNGTSQNLRHGLLTMAALICPVCKKSLNKGIWDNHTQRIYCAQCIPPLPQSEGMASSVRTRSESGHKIDSKRLGDHGETPSMNEPERIVVEPPDNACERCGHLRPRLVFDQLSKLVLCESCMEYVQREQAWSLLRDADRA